ncbi:MAG TPA: MerR family DNA-binding transcriptional regulator [Bacillota bacterium]|nr:MerR family DNA-binding transcriptional regulator [Bacillota bacterium]
MSRPKSLYLRIGDLAARSGVSKQLIHYYLRRGYLHPPIYKRGNQAF